MIYIGLIIGIIMFIIYIREIMKTKFTTRLIFIIGIFTALAYVLNLIKFIRMPQGGSITLFSMLPVMVLSLLYGKGVGLTSGILLGFLKMLDGITFVHPVQFLLDYILSNMALGFSGMFGRDSKVKIFFGCIISGFLGVMFNVISGVVFFSEFAPENMNIWMYSIIYNFSSLGVEVFLTTIVMMFFPLDRIIKISKLQEVTK